MNRTFAIFLGVLSGLTWAMDIQILSIITASPIIITLFHDFGALLVNLGSIKSLRFNKMLVLGYLIGTLGTVGFVGASIYGGPVVGAVVSTLMPLMTYILYGRYDKKKTLCYIVASILLYVLSSYQGSLSLLGVMLGLLCAVGWSLETVILNKYSEDIDAGALVLGRMMVGCLILISISPFFIHTVSNLNVLWYATGAGLIGGLSYKLWYTAILELGPDLANSLNLTYLLFIIIFTTTGFKLLEMSVIGATYILLILYVSKEKRSINL